MQTTTASPQQLPPHVEKELRQWQASLKALLGDNAAQPTALRTIQCPRIGAAWPEHGGHYIGIAAGDEGQPDYHLIRGAYAPSNLNHAAALEYARNCRDGGFSDWDLAERTDGALIYANDRASMRGGWHWLKPQCAHHGACAWVQGFGDGDQDY